MIVHLIPVHPSKRGMFVRGALLGAAMALGWYGSTRVTLVYCLHSELSVHKIDRASELVVCRSR